MATRPVFQIRCHPDSIDSVKVAAARARRLVLTAADMDGVVILSNWHNVEIVSADTNLQPGTWVMDQVAMSYEASGSTIPTFT